MEVCIMKCAVRQYLNCGFTCLIDRPRSSILAYCEARYFSLDPRLNDKVLFPALCDFNTKPSEAVVIIEGVLCSCRNLVNKALRNLHNVLQYSHSTQNVEN